MAVNDLNDGASPTAMSRALDFATSIRTNAKQLFGLSSEYERLCDVAERLEDDCRRLATGATTTLPVLTIVGCLAAGKSWLARCFLDEHPDNDSARESIRSGPAPCDRTSQVTLLGPERPFASDDKDQEFIRIDRMLVLGTPYVIVDSPGFQDEEPSRRQLISHAVDSSRIKLLVLSFREIGDRRIPSFIAQMDGSIILPVIKFSPKDDKDLSPPVSVKDDVDAEILQWRQASPASEFLPPLYMPAEHTSCRNATENVRKQLKERLSPLLRDPKSWSPDVKRQIESRVSKARQQVADAVPPWLSRLASLKTIPHLNPEVKGRFIRELLGDPLLLRAGVRHRLRARWLDRTPEVCFPYRTFCGTLTLTAGAWDKLLFAASGSLPSLASTIFQATKNLREAGRVNQLVRRNIRRRIEQSIEHLVRSDLLELDRRLKSSSPRIDHSNEGSPSSGWSIEVLGVETIQEESRSLFTQAIENHSAPRIAACVWGLIGALVFWALLGGPIFSLYRSYFNASAHTLEGRPASLEEFPLASMPMILTSMFLSAAPVFVMALVGVWWSCHERRTQRCLKEVEDDHKLMIQDCLNDGRVRYKVSDDRLDAALFFLSIDH